MLLPSPPIPCSTSASAAPQRIAYRLREGRVERLAWTSIDTAPRAEPVATAILEGAAALTFRFLDPKSAEWRPDWGLPGNAVVEFPAAVEMTLALASGERIVRLFDLRVPSALLSAMPYILTVIILAGFVGRAIPPRAGGEPYVKER